MQVRHTVSLSVLIAAAALGLLALISPTLFLYAVMIPAGVLFERTLGKLIPVAGGGHGLGVFAGGRFYFDGALGFVFWLVAIGLGTYFFVRHDDDWR